MRPFRFIIPIFLLSLCLSLSAGFAEPLLNHLNCLDPRDVRSLNIVSDDRSFSFNCTENVYVNGEAADPDVFDLLLRQILDMPVSACSPVTIPGSLKLSVSIGTQNKDYAIECFHDPENNPGNVIIRLQDDGSTWETAGWIIGTIMMTCDGTRILNGEEPET